MRWSGVPISLVMCLLSAVANAQTPDIQPDGRAQINLPAGELSEGLNTIARSFDVNLLVPAELLQGRKHTGFRETLTLEKALSRLLADQNLEARFIDKSSVAIIASVPKVTAQPAAAPDPPARQISSTPPVPVQADTHRVEDKVIVTGTRAQGRTVFEALAPIDVISSDELGQTASDELLDGLAQSLPTFNAFRLPLNDGNIFNRPNALRGLSSDMTLILVNGKRRHRSAFLETSRGQPTDLSQIPVTSIGQVEVLRDGASAQYGSDAIGGVINVILEDTPETSAFAQVGEYFEGDGDAWRTGLQTGSTWEGDSFAVFGFEAFHSDPTSRSVQRADALAFQEDNPDIRLPDPVQRWGQPEREGWRLGLNSVLAASDHTEAYAFGTFGLSQGISDFNWRNPDVSSAYASSEAFPEYDLRDFYPAGFTPRFGQEEADLSIYAGLRSDRDTTFQWDASLGYGGNRIDYILNNSINASLGPESPRDFRPGHLQQSEIMLNLDGSVRLARMRGADSGQLSFGLEYRHETYEIRSGDPASYAVGPGAEDGLPSGSNGFPGYAPDQTGEFDQDSLSFYTDLEIDLNEKLTLGLATRYEDYSLFGDALNGKLSFRYEITPELALRGTASTGFRAPTAGQVYSQRTSQGLDSITLDSVTNGRFSPESTVAVILSRRDDVSINSLGPETSVNLTTGISLRTAAGLTFTIDAFHISIEDEFGRSPGYELTAEERSLLHAINPVLGRASNVYFFQNTIDQTTEGIDMVANQIWDIGAGELSVALAWSHVDKSVDGSRYDAEYIRDQVLLNPHLNDSVTVSSTYRVGDLELYARLRGHGEWKGSSGLEENPVQTFGARAFLDLSLKWQADASLAVKVGAENILNVYPDPALNQSNRGLIYSRDSPYDTDGGLFYLRLTKKF